MAKKVSKLDIKAESQAGLAITGFLGTVTLFFTGILISQLNNFSNSIKVPVIFLIISTFSFVFSAIIYSNTTGLLSIGRLAKSTRSIVVANALSEYYGIYGFVLATPMVIIAISSDPFLRLSVAAIALVSIFLYTLSSFSIFRRTFRRGLDILFAVLIAATAAALYYSQLYLLQYYEILAIVLFLLLTVVTIFSEERRVRG